MERRDFLKQLSMAGVGVAGSSLLSSHSLAQTMAGVAEQDHFLLVMSMEGGWDVTLGLDPWTAAVRPDPKDFFIEYAPEELIKIQNVFLGPACAPLQNINVPFAVINGIFMNTVDNGHPASHNYMETGTTNTHAASYAVETEYCQNKSPYGVLSNGSVIRGARSTLVSATDSMATLIYSQDPTSDLVPLLQNTNHLSALVEAQTDLVKSAGVSKNLIESLKGLNAKYNVLKEPQVIAAAFQSRASYSAQISIPDVFLDTHGDHVAKHLSFQKKGWQFVADMIEILKSLPLSGTQGSVMDRTTIVVYSEFSRTAALNSAGGKDHNPLLNSVFIAGCGVKGPQTIGASKNITRARSKIGLPYHIAVPFDFANCQAVDSRTGTEFMFPENIVRTIAEVMRVDFGKFANVPQSTKLLSKVLA